MNDQWMQERVGYAVKRAFQAERVAIDRLLHDMGLTGAQWGVMMCLRHKEDLSNAELARLNTCTPQSMNEIVRHLEVAGWVERTAQPGRGAALPARLTGVGLEHLAKAEQRVIELEGRMLRDLDHEEQVQLIALLNRCIAALQEDNVESPA